MCLRICCSRKEGLSYNEFLGVVYWADYASMDDGTSTTDIASDDWEVSKARAEVPADDDSSDEEETEELTKPTPVLTTREALACPCE